MILSTNNLTKKNRKFIFQEKMREHFEKILNSEGWDNLVLITRKGYWVYKLMNDHTDQKHKVLFQHRKVYNDRYITKCLDMSEFEGKRVWVYDDSMTTGTNLFFFFSYLKKHKAEVTPIVFGLSAEYSRETSEKLLKREFLRVCRGENWSEEEIEKRALEDIELFDSKLQWEVMMSAEDIATLCSDEVQFFHDCLCPMVIDLPILACMKKADETFTVPAYMNEGTSEGIVISLEQFEKLKSSDPEWEFCEKEVNTETIRVNCSYFRYKNSLFWAGVSPAIHDLIIKCKYRIEGDQVRVVFVPFAIFRSMSFHDLICCFLGLFKDTEYGDMISEYIAEELPDAIVKIKQEGLAESPEIYDLLKKNHNLCRNIFRSIILYTSDVLGDLFRNYVFRLTGIEMAYDWEIMDDAFSKKFKNAFQNISEKRKIDERVNCLIHVKNVSPIDMESSVHEQKVKASEEEVEIFVLDSVIRKRRKDDSNIRNRVYTIESMQAELEQYFLFKSTEEEKSFLTRSICSLQETSRFGNEIYVDNEKECIYRGFRYGENSELLFLTGMEYVCAFVVAFYCYILVEKAGEGGYPGTYKRLYSRFAQKLEEHFKTENYFSHIINQRVFEFLIQYFGSIPDDKLEEQIMNKRYVLKNYRYPEKERGLKVFVDRAFQLVPQWLE